jgi:hypothetical protein
MSPLPTTVVSSRTCSRAEATWSSTWSMELSGGGDIRFPINCGLFHCRDLDVAPLWFFLLRIERSEVAWGPTREGTIQSDYLLTPHIPLECFVGSKYYATQWHSEYCHTHISYIKMFKNTQHPVNPNDTNKPRIYVFSSLFFAFLDFKVKKFWSKIWQTTLIL